MAGPLLASHLAMGGQPVEVPPTANSQVASRATTVTQRAKALVRWVWTGESPAEQWFGPGQPLTPVAPEDVAGRMRDYPLTANLQWSPRAEEFTPFEELYQLANTHDITRLCIETRKDQMARQRWTIRKRVAPGGKKFGEEIPDLTEFFKSPDRRERWQQWQGRILEDLFVGDCPSVYVRRDLKGDVWGFEPIDGSTIILRLDPWGRVPLQGEAYTQRIKGLPAVAYSRDQLIYAPRRPRNQKGYGLSPVEQIIITVNIALRRQFHQLSWYQDGSTPDLIVGIPKDWSGKEIEKLEGYWQSHFRGNSAERRGRPLLVIGGNECKFENTKKDPLKDEFDEWLARVVCYCFSLPPTPFVRQMNRATAETAQQAAQQEGLEPLKDWMKDLVDDMLLRMGHPEAELAWTTEEAIDPLVRAQVHNAYIGSGTMKRNEARDQLGLDPLPDDEIPTLPEAQAIAALVTAGIMDPDAAAEKLGLPKPTPKPDPIPPIPAAPGPGNSGAPKPVGGTPTPEPPTKKLTKGKRKDLPSRNREDLLRMEASYTLAVAKELNQIRKAVIGRVRDGSYKLAKDDRELESPGSLVNVIVADDFQRLRKLLGVRDLELYQAGVSAAAKALDANDEMIHLANDRGIDWAEAHAGEQVTRIEETTREGVNDLVHQAMTEGWSNDHLASELEEAWEFGADRAELIARTETAMADKKGNIELSKEAGVREVVWVAAEADACDQCEALDGKTAPIDGQFDDGTAADDVAHPNCRCDVAAIIPDEDEKEAIAKRHREELTAERELVKAALVPQPAPVIHLHLPAATQRQVRIEYDEQGRAIGGTTEEIPT